MHSLDVAFLVMLMTMLFGLELHVSLEAAYYNAHVTHVKEVSWN